MDTHNLHVKWRRVSHSVQSVVAYTGEWGLAVWLLDFSSYQNVCPDDQLSSARRGGRSLGQQPSFSRKLTKHRIFHYA
ncbi:Uncharacterized protein HZ326_15675 [Fusarium oxysporum f. sp. albedinis]|nr:Uncharacterized protein HZ326_15675 [Fusarium oxysporum f. sp. albedinis]